MLEHQQSEDHRIFAYITNDPLFYKFMNKKVFSKIFSWLPIFLILFLIYPDTAKAQENTITLDVKDTPIKIVMSQIEKQTKYLFVYTDEVEVNIPVSVSVKSASLDRALKAVFGNTGIAYRISGTNIILSAKATENQEKPIKISGVVIDAYGQPIIGAGVILKGTTSGTVTDIDGKFSMELPAGSKDGVLQFTCLGYTTVEMAADRGPVFNVTLSDDAQLLDGTVVTALGIRRSEKALAYNVQQVNPDAILTNKDANFVNSLNGKVAGLVINASSSGVGGASKVVMRGSKSIAKSSNALYVVDGVPMYTSPRDAGTEFDSRGATDPIADLNPEDIESMSVLTGAAAAALYGSEAANGAIVITTRKGVAGKTSITVTSNTEVSSPFVLPRFQSSYGTGDLNQAEGSTVRSWGHKLGAHDYMGYKPSSDYFKEGVTATESVSLSTGTEHNQTYLSAAAVNSTGNVPNTKYDRYNFTGRNTSSFFKDKVTLDLSASLVRQDDQNMANQGLYNNPLVGAYLFPRGNDWNAIRMFERYNPERNISEQYWPVGDAGITMQNPYWINYRNLRNNVKYRYKFGAGLNWKIADWITLSGRINYDGSSNTYKERFYASTNQQLTESSANGLFGMEKAEDRQIYADALLDINKTWKDWSLHANIGASISDMSYDQFSIRGPIADGSVEGEATNLPNVFNVFTLSQSRTQKKQSGWNDQTQSVYASAEIGYKSTYYLTLTGRNDWASQLAGPQSGAKSFFYPSVGASVVISQIIGKMPENLEYLKIRTSYASVGSAFDRFIANPLYTWPDKGSGWNTQTSYPIENLRPEKTNSWEVGLEMRFLKWFNLNATWYSTHTLNQTIYPNISTGSGYSSIPIQSGDVKNTGFELSVGFDKEWGIFGWNSSYTFSANRNKIVSLADNAVNPVTGEQLNISSLNMGGLGNARFILREGGSLGDLYSRAALKRDSEGYILVDENGGVSSETITNVDEYIHLGSVLPKANMAWRNDFNIGNLNFGFMLTARIGGVVYSRTQAMLDYYGVSEATATARDNGGVPVDGCGFVNANKWYSTIAGGDTVPQYYTYSATNVRLQEASIGYDFPRKWFRNVCEITVQLVGRNLWMIYNKAPFDPEAIATTGNYYQGIDYFMTPNTRNFGFNLRIRF